MTEPYHFIECGLNNIYLINGFKRIIHNFKVEFVFEDLPELYQAIGRHICTKPFLTGAEFRFLRQELRMTQRTCSAKLGVTENMVSLWERKAKIPKMILAIMKGLYLEQFGYPFLMIDLLLTDETPRPDKAYFFVDEQFTWRFTDKPTTDPYNPRTADAYECTDEMLDARFKK